MDDFLEQYTKLGAEKGYEICSKQDKMNAEEIWMREPVLQCREELAFYEEIFEFLSEDLRLLKENDIITEGPAYLLHLIKALNVPKNRYLSITLEKDFQIFHYKKREWVPHVLEGCGDKEKAFSNWMQRDVLFAKEVQRQCDEEGYASIINDGSIEVDELVSKVTVHFGFDDCRK